MRPLLDRAVKLNLDGISYWKGLDVGELPLTPLKSDGSFFKSDRTSECILFNLAMEMNLQPKAYRAEKKGAIVHNVIPIQGKEDSYSNMGSGEFPMHVEAPHLEDRPDYIAILCLRGNPEAITPVAHVKDILKHISTESILELYQEHFILKSGESWAKGGYEIISILQRVVSYICQIRVSLAYVQGITEKAKIALQELEFALNQPGVVQEFCLESGDLLLLNNRTCVHGRRPFKTEYSGYHRWLQRMYYVYPS